MTRARSLLMRGLFLAVLLLPIGGAVASADPGEPPDRLPDDPGYGLLGALPGDGGVLAPLDDDWLPDDPGYPQ